MSKIFSIVGVGALTLVMGLASVAPSVAAPLYQCQAGGAHRAIELVQYHQPDRRHWDNNGHHPHRRPPHYRPGYWNRLSRL